MMHSQFGDELKFFIVFEIDLARENPPEGWCRRHTIRTAPIALTTGRKSNLRKFIVQWFGEDVASVDFAKLDTEILIGRPAEILVGHEKKESVTYAKILACVPYEGEEPLKPSGTYVREKDRTDKGGHGPAAAGAGQAGKGSTYRPASGAEPAKPDRVMTDAEILASPGDVKVPFGKLNGQELRDLSKGDVQNLIERFLWRDLLTIEKPTAAQRRLKLALEVYEKRWGMVQAGAAAGAKQTQPEPEEESEFVPEDY